ncbi:MAG: hypothetical protein ACSLEX_02895 [Minisyncoccota bacterium]
MAKTFYIDSDEEIISVIGRLRKSSDTENIFVFPKRALVLQSIVNLRLLQREAQKMSKGIMVVTQDDMGRMLATKAGIATENYSDERLATEVYEETIPTEEMKPLQIPPEAFTPHSPFGVRVDMIGSQDFYVTPDTQERRLSKQTALAQPMMKRDDPKKLRVRNMTPEKMTSLNSLRSQSEYVKHPPLPVSNSSGIPAFVPASRDRLAPVPPTPTVAETEISRSNRLKNFYNNQDISPTPTSAKPAPLINSAVSGSGKKMHFILAILGTATLLSVVGVGLFLFVPKAEIHLTPYRITQPVDITLNGQSSGSTVTSADMLMVRIFAREYPISVAVPATGKSSSVNQKARGTVIISNNYSTEPQTLVATTRFETSDGKLFRLVKSVTVPGMTGSSAGVIEAEVIADQSGEVYNIEPTTFHIPGFKGNPKYDAFTVQSKKTMLGGGNEGLSDVSVVARVDLETAEREAREKAKEEFLREARGTLKEDEKILEEQMDVTALQPVAGPQIGMVANMIEYQNTFKIQAFIFPEEQIHEKVENVVNKELQGVPFHPVSSLLAYDDSLPDFTTGTVRLKVRALVTMESVIDNERIKESLLGKDEQALQDMLPTLTAVKKMRVSFHPEWLMRSVPKSSGRTVIFVESGEMIE